ncbi:hypothetical protein EHZ19_16190 [Paraburkholderia bannensis]|nr:hypothetical protein [Paraburkholderia bannensis]RQM47191.1 hypothetical protein EHZ19_16190 [Paraburkholderia bannensis]
MSTGTRHIWTKAAVDLQTSATRHQKTRHSLVRIELKPAGIKPGGLLQAMFDDSEIPTSTKNANHIRTIIQNSESRRFSEIMSTHPSLLDSQDIQELITLSDDIISKNENRKSNSYIITSLRHFLCQVRTPLSNGELIQNSSMLSKFKWKDPNQKPFDSAHFQAGTETQNALPHLLDSIEFDSLSERNKKAIDLHNEFLSRIEAMCTDVLNVHERFVERIRTLLKTELPQSVHKATINSIAKGGRPYPRTLAHMDDETKLHVVIAFSAASKLHIALHRFRFPNYHIASLDAATSIKVAGRQYSVLLSNYYLPRHVVVTCLIIIIRETGWNISTTLSLTKTEVHSTEAGGYLIDGLKAKTDDIQLAKTVNDSTTSSASEHTEPDLNGDIQTYIREPIYIGDKLAVRALRLLLDHRANIDKYCRKGSRSDSLFVSLLYRTENKRYIFDIEDVAIETRRLHQTFKIPPFFLSDIRTANGNLLYLTTGDIFKVQTYYNHASPETAAGYVYKTLTSLLLDANMLRYMKHLEASIIYNVGRKLTESKKKS